MKRKKPTDEEIVEIVREMCMEERRFASKSKLKPKELPQHWKDRIDKEFPDLTKEWESR